MGGYPTLPAIKELFHDWQDYDFAEYHLCCLFGLVEHNEHTFLENKGVFWSENRLGTMLHQTLENLVSLEILERNNDSQYRYNRLNRSSQEIAYNK